MRFLRFQTDAGEGLAVEKAGAWRGLTDRHPAFPGDLDDLVRDGSTALGAAYTVLASGDAVKLDSIRYLPPFTRPSKIICVGLNYLDHAAESGFTPPKFPTLFARFVSSLVEHEGVIQRPKLSDTLDYEGEVVAVIGRGGRHIPLSEALSHVAGYSIFNDGSVREYQHNTPQWTVGKNFDATGGFGPYFVTADEVPPGAKGLKIQTRLNGQVVQSASTDDLIFDVATLVSFISEAMTLDAGDLIVTGTPSGVGHARNPKLYMRPGDVCEVEVEGLGLLRNRIEDEAAA